MLPILPLMIYWLTIPSISIAVETQLLPQRQGNFSTVLFFPLKDLAIPQATYQLSLLQGTVENLVLVDDEIRFWAGPDQGKDQELLLSLAGPQQIFHLPVLLKSLRPTKELVLQHQFFSPPTEIATPLGPAPEFTVLSGLGAGNQLLLAPWAFQLRGEFVERAQCRRLELYHLASRSIIVLAEELSGENGIFKLSVEEIQRHWEKIPAGEAQLIFKINTTTSNGTSSEELVVTQYQLNVFKGQTSLQGKLMDKDGKKGTQWAQKKVAIRGHNNRVSMVVEINNEGSFQVDNLVPGLYDVTLLDVLNPGTISGSVEIFSTDQQREITLLTPTATESPTPTPTPTPTPETVVSPTVTPTPTVSQQEKQVASDL